MPARLAVVSLGAIALVGFFVGPTAALDLVRDGKPVATIVAKVKPEPTGKPAGKAGRAGKAGKAAQRARPETDDAEASDGSETLAVQILVDWLKKITDAELPVAASAPEGRPAIYVGQAAIAAGLKLDDIASPSHEGLRIVADDSRVHIAGQNGAATAKAVCRFLEELGCRYLMDTPLGEVYPRSRNLSVGKLSITEKPGLLARHPKGPSWRGGYWTLWNGAGGETLNHSHAWGKYCPVELFDKHPEFFAMNRDGERKPIPWYCTSNQELRKVFADNVIAAIHEGRKHPSLSPTDGRSYCQCPACLAQDDPKVIEPSSGTPAISNRYADFFDAVGRLVAPACPDSILSFYCYADYTQPPSLGHKLSPNLCAVIAPIRYCRLHAVGDPNCPSRMQQTEMVEGWAKIAGRLGYYNYMYNLADATLPMFKFTPCKKEFPYLADKGLTGMTMEVLSNWHIYGPHIYLGLRLAYDPHADADAVMEDYWQKFFGPRAAPFMKAYWMGIDEATNRLTSHSGGFYGLQEIYTPEFIAHCQSLVDQAAQAAKDDPVYSQRVALHAQGLQSARQYRQICDCMARGQFAEAKKVYDSMIDRLDALAAKGSANREYATAYLRRFLLKTIEGGVAATAAPHKVLQVLPDQWRMAYDDEDQGEAKGLQRVACDTSSWKPVATYSRTLSSQGLREMSVLWYRNSFQVPAQHGRLALFFGEIDGLTDVYVNGTRLNVAAAEPAKGKGGGKGKAGAKAKTPPPGVREGQARRRAPFEVDVTDAVHPGENVIVIRADNRRITELFLGGILRPGMLVEKAAQ
jgi:hypothetical protein